MSKLYFQTQKGMPLSFHIINSAKNNWPDSYEICDYISCSLLFGTLQGERGNRAQNTKESSLRGRANICVALTKCVLATLPVFKTEFEVELQRYRKLFLISECVQNQKFRGIVKPGWNDLYLNF